MYQMLTLAWKFTVGIVGRDRERFRYELGFLRMTLLFPVEIIQNLLVMAVLRVSNRLLKRFNNFSIPRRQL